jgi:hypothetical protein
LSVLKDDSILFLEGSDISSQMTFPRMTDEMKMKELWAFKIIKHHSPTNDAIFLSSERISPSG